MLKNITTLTMAAILSVGIIGTALADSTNDDPPPPPSEPGLAGVTVYLDSNTSTMNANFRTNIGSSGDDGVLESRRSREFQTEPMPQPHRRPKR